MKNKYDLNESDEEEDAMVLNDAVAKLQIDVDEIKATLKRIEAHLTGSTKKTEEPSSRRTSSAFRPSARAPTAAKKTPSKDENEPEPKVEAEAYESYFQDPDDLEILARFKKSPMNYASMFDLEDLGRFYAIVDVLKSKQVSPKLFGIGSADPNVWEAIHNNVESQIDRLERMKTSAASRYF